MGVAAASDDIAETQLSIDDDMGDLSSISSSDIIKEDEKCYIYHVYCNVCEREQEVAYEKPTE